METRDRLVEHGRAHEVAHLDVAQRLQVLIHDDDARAGRGERHQVLLHSYDVVTIAGQGLRSVGQVIA